MYKARGRRSLFLISPVEALPHIITDSTVVTHVESRLDTGPNSAFFAEWEEAQIGEAERYHTTLKCYSNSDMLWANGWLKFKIHETEVQKQLNSSKSWPLWCWKSWGDKQLYPMHYWSLVLISFIREYYWWTCVIHECNTNQCLSAGSLQILRTSSYHICISNIRDI